jgi:hypothetical protein
MTNIKWLVVDGEHFAWVAPIEVPEFVQCVPEIPFVQDLTSSHRDEQQSAVVISVSKQSQVYSCPLACNLPSLLGRRHLLGQAGTRLCYSLRIQAGVFRV